MLQSIITLYLKIFPNKGLPIEDKAKLLFDLKTRFKGRRALASGLSVTECHMTSEEMNIQNQSTVENSYC